MAPSRKVSPWIALSSAALALPAFSAAPPDQIQFGLKTTAYRESDQDSGTVLAGSDQRYDINVNQFYLITPVGRNWSFAVDLSHESMSGASPWGTLAAVGADSQLVMSGATIEEARNELSLGATRYFERSSFAVSLTRSKENDYEADALAVNAEWDFNDKLSTLALGLSYSSDELEPTDALMFGRVSSETKQSRSLSLGWTQVLSRSSVLQSGFSITDHRGYLSDPYKLRDIRPDQRLETAINVRYRHFIEPVNSSLHLDYRFYRDDFGIRSHTLRGAWYQNLTSQFQLIPSMRYYSQNQADFYVAGDNYGLADTVFQSSDYRLSGFGALTFGLQGRFSRRDWSVSVNFERYLSSASYGLDASASEHPGLLQFNLLSLGFDIKL
ncbi:MAG: DUF3570 domain-containing protein [Gammaproteobacteria bacterium]|jgi:hypothetical protein|nr:DUF3570 domain-containing protein [Gammaproteobacteria bacterium]MBT5204508.1 DUF3570 domain-containing protein [Gammaproteobacteria bacterium]MBT5604159.1 DUF3570 domain-containing protein [Gammaproteobacteria bacterium]MBT6246744.1 DUF3570 domain-containing protein [Gammaproteobacteria bacterium]